MGLDSVVKEELPKVPDLRDRSWHQVIERPNDLKKKVPRTGGKDPEKAFAEAEEVVRKLEREYVEKLAEDIDRLEFLGERYTGGRGQETLDELFKLIHNMRGQGATFGYPLITRIGRSFCRYVRELPEEKSVTPELIDQHINAMKVVYKQSIKGEGDEIAQTVVDALDEVVSHELSG